ncbi:exonuclease SbcCD subunit D [Corynebacterium sp. CCUG 71335]|uniref:metallophosphoesterase family protein n=1 Tax=Corynebacterium sp. CCUG 71335 TaxID=2823892 RepID=UPI00210EF860|nr:exonuclease SbcCD subunit D [Corynebacterium sp. CCUG 71335]MCQ4619633.1 exonuclease SbcCD subunit D [Corynebacterium sp. CCUG 71335]
MGSAQDSTHVTFIHTSDFQWGMTRWFLDGEDSDAQSRFEDSRLRAVEKLGNLAREHGAEFIVVAGDVFDANALSERTMGRALEVLGSLPVPVFLLPGNHDPLLPGAALEHAAQLSNVTVLADSTPVEVRPGVEIVGAPLLARYANEDLAARALAQLEPTDSVRILVAHGQAEGRGEQDPALMSLAGLETALTRGVIDYVALGDTHSAQQVGTSGRIWFSGAPETTDFHDRRGNVAGNEVNSGKALVVSVDKRSATDVDVDVNEHAVGEWTFDALHWEVSDGEDVRRVIAELEAYPHKSRTAVKYSLAGTLGLEATRELEEGLAAQRSVFGALYERERLMDLHLEPNDEELANLPLSGYARDAMSALLGASETSDPQTARDAVNLLFRLSKEPK